ncbi:glycosyltransferase family 4 protein [Formosa algae]|uniref:Glycosyltransferase involved in cell wall biosynthesis n=1 Tax=Formosa algae TaxID=225843 RepID=A0A9X0YI67_9FLAO|nr:glycosyltransferase family 4 protein [Formosa algae]MBP1839107.1 glycosyltransferase involved in cell wall biosynthesis [Formosa algae]MDQ0333884.1 glycosyltransferase involved in cell wall biosynthesis [Formosa algae]OEI79740.1 glycosyl transferase family 1 [Formosa algae]
MKKLAIVTTHPIQYYAPWFKLMAERGNVEVKVFYTWSQAAEEVKDKTFGKTIKWDIPLLEGYTYEFVNNVSEDPGTHHKNGIDCPELNDKISSWKPDAVLIFGWYLKSHLNAMKFFKGKIPVWFRGDSTLLDDSPGIKQVLRKYYLTYIYRFIDKAFYVGSQNKAYFRSVGLKESQLILAPHAIDNERFNDSENKNYEALATKWRKELGYTSNDLVVLFAGKFESKKQPDFLLKAIQKANINRETALKLLMVGHGPLENELLKLAENDSNIKFIPFQNQSKMPILYRLGNVFCLPSKGPGETWGLAVNEAMASSKPVIVSTKVGCASDIVQTGKNGFTFNYQDELALIDIFNTLSIDKLKTMGDAAEQNINKWNFKAIVEALEQAF